MATIKERAKKWTKETFGCFLKTEATCYYQGAVDQIDLLRNALIERQGEYISLELIKEIFEEYGND